MSIDPRRLWGYFAARFRPGRIRQMKERFPGLATGATVLDVGGRAEWWRMMQPATPHVTVVNLETEDAAALGAAGYRFVVASGCALPFADRSFDVVMSNSVIEHVGDFETQARFAREVLRCGREVYVQTPNKWFPVEPHLLMPFAHWLPRRPQRALIPWMSAWAITARPPAAAIESFLDSTRLLTRREVVQLFPGCEISEERVLGLVKSFVVTRKASPAP
ncbi:MAG TPA: class I SAM-dependent methyltransferase [Usitatibacter sp.]|nr:class I SAM-dependent methyltransferase [Usitatibacter sp.]